MKWVLAAVVVLIVLIALMAIIGANGYLVALGKRFGETVAPVRVT